MTVAEFRKYLEQFTQDVELEFQLWDGEVGESNARAVHCEGATELKCLSPDRPNIVCVEMTEFQPPHIALVREN